MKTEQPAPHQPLAAAVTSPAETSAKSSASAMPHPGLAHPKHEASIMSFPLSRPQRQDEKPIQKWSRVQMLRFALIGCGSFWIFVALLAWEFLRAR